ncbi:MAG: acyl-CoA dehydrogenase family protein, partial [Desulfobulbia bacterium]
MLETTKKNINSPVTQEFDWADPFDIEGQLTEEELLIRETAERFAEERLKPVVLEGFRNEVVDKSLLADMGQLGLLGMTMPEEYGGTDQGYVAYGIVAREMEKVDSGYRSTLSVQSSLVISPIYEFGSQQQKEKYLPRLISGESIGCFGLTEPDHGSDAGGLKTRAIKTDEGYILNGSKMWISNSPIADLAIVWAKTED